MLPIMLLFKIYNPIEGDDGFGCTRGDLRFS